MHQISKRAKYMATGEQPYGLKLTSKTHKDQRAHRAKLHGTRAGWLEHNKRERRRATENRRVHKRQNREWNGD